MTFPDAHGRCQGGTIADALMKYPVLFILASFLLPLNAESPLSTGPSLEALLTSRIPALDLESQTFEQSFARIEAEWRRQHPDLSFPVALVDYENKSGAAKGPWITMHLKDVPFYEALRYAGDASKWGLKKGPGILRAENASEIVEDWYLEIYPLAPGIRRKLGLGAKPAKKDVAAAYTQYGVRLEAWMEVGLSGDKLVLVANKEQHQQIAGINFLLGQGFTITKDSAR